MGPGGIVAALWYVARDRPFSPLERMRPVSFGHLGQAGQPAHFFFEACVAVRVTLGVWWREGEDAHQASSVPE